MKPKILILYTSIGLGHKSIAENIGYWLEQFGYEVRLEDVLKVQGGTLVDVGTKIHHIINTKLPFIWSFLYDNTWFTKLSLPFRTKIAAGNYHKTKQIIDAYQPDMVITTQTTASAIIAYLKQKKMYSGKFGITFSDFHLHEYWLYNEADFYLVNIEDQKTEMKQLGIPAEKIFIVGMTLKPQPSINKNEIRKKYNTVPTNKVVLVGSGSLGTGIDENIIRQFAVHKNIKIVVVCGKNKQAYDSLTQAFVHNEHVKILGYANMEELYAIADVFIGKPGGLSTAEALRWNLPLLVSHMLPGQEELNVQFLRKKGLVMPVPVSVTGDAMEEIEGHAVKKQLERNPYKAELFPEPCVLRNVVMSVIQTE